MHDYKGTYLKLYIDVCHLLNFASLTQGQPFQNALINEKSTGNVAYIFVEWKFSPLKLDWLILTACQPDKG